MRTHGVRTAAALALGSILLAAALPYAAPPGGDEWKYDVIHRKKGKPLYGLVLDEGPTVIKYLYIVRKPGTPTIIIQDEISRAEVEEIDRLSAADREAMEERV